ncbi:SdpI family protein [Nonomuraea roseoviolacea]|uniref:Membrane protein n=1 Tax=Nonomuraea roseoviolacea subsp. carminata TaxID=160689 RepID=A0ABT1JY15_9ACTN|nr:SdpI family protein [Nonomuraea roseoviolacea]MCP2345664.1 putative membrane protein [Nonomuraea roseoviolacea subsp. carminata]
MPDDRIPPADGEDPTRPSRMDTRPTAIGAALLVLGTAALSLWAWTRIPDDARLPLHWDASGKADRLGGKTEALTTLPVVILVLAALLVVLPRVVPDRRRLAGSARGYNIIAIGVLGLLAAIHAASVLGAVTGSVPLLRVVSAALGLFTVALGMALPGLRPNWIAGIRTPWTLADERCWALTHRFGGRLFTAVGAILTVAALTAPEAILMPLALAGIAGAGVIAVIYSWRVRGATSAAPRDGGSGGR